MEEKPQRFEELNLLPGHNLQLAIDSYGSDRGKSLLIGHLAKNSIVVTAPVIAGIPSILNIGTQLTVRMFVPRIGSVCAFRTEVMHAARQPYSHMHLSMPKDIVIGEVRRSVRAQVALPGEAFVGDEFANKHQVVLTDLSVGGTCLEVTEPLAPTDEPIRITTRIVVENVERKLAIEGIIRAADYHDERKTVSVQFTKLSDNDRIALYAYVMKNLYQ